MSRAVLVVALALVGCATTAPCRTWREAGWIRLADGRQAKVCQGAQASWYGWQTCRAVYVAEGATWIRVAEECTDAPKAKRAPVRRLR